MSGDRPKLYTEVMRILRLCRRAKNICIGRDLLFFRDVKIPRVWHGDMDCGWCVAKSPHKEGCIVYSFGLGDNITFEVSLASESGTAVHGFDPTPRSLGFVSAISRPAGLTVYRYGIADYDGTASFYPPSNAQNVSYTMLSVPGRGGLPIEVPVHRLSSIMKRLGHDRIDILKMDIEGAEYAVISDILSSGIRVGQLLVEFHHRFPGVGIEKTKQAVELLRSADYQLFWVSESGEEFGFIHGLK